MEPGNLAYGTLDMPQPSGARFYSLDAQDSHFNSDFHSLITSATQITNLSCASALLVNEGGHRSTFTRDVACAASNKSCLVL